MVHAGLIIGLVGHFPLAFGLAAGAAPQSRVLIRRALDDSVSTGLAYLHPSRPQCTICYRSVASDDRFTTNCRHVFHGGCLLRWALSRPEQGPDVTCPSCRGHLLDGPPRNAVGPAVQPPSPLPEPRTVEPGSKANEQQCAFFDIDAAMRETGGLAQSVHDASGKASNSAARLIEAGPSDLSAPNVDTVRSIAQHAQELNTEAHSVVEHLRETRTRSKYLWQRGAMGQEVNQNSVHEHCAAAPHFRQVVQGLATQARELAATLEHVHQLVLLRGTSKTIQKPRLERRITEELAAAAGRHDEWRQRHDRHNKSPQGTEHIASARRAYYLNFMHRASEELKKEARMGVDRANEIQSTLVHTWPIINSAWRAPRYRMYKTTSNTVLDWIHVGLIHRQDLKAISPKMSALKEQILELAQSSHPPDARSSEPLLKEWTSELDMFFALQHSLQDVYRRVRRVTFMVSNKSGYPDAASIEAAVQQMNREPAVESERSPGSRSGSGSGLSVHDHVSRVIAARDPNGDQLAQILGPLASTRTLPPRSPPRGRRAHRPPQSTTITQPHSPRDPDAMQVQVTGSLPADPAVDTARQGAPHQDTPQPDNQQPNPDATQ